MDCISEWSGICVPHFKSLSLSLTDMLVGMTTISPVLASIPNLFSRSEPCSVKYTVSVFCRTGSHIISHFPALCSPPTGHKPKEKIECEPQPSNIFKGIRIANKCILEWMFAIL